MAREAEILHAFPNSKDPRRSLLVVLEPFAELGAVLDERDKSASAKQHADRLLQGGIRQPRTLHNPTGGVSSVPPDDLEVGQKGACLVSHAPPHAATCQLLCALAVRAKVSSALLDALLKLKINLWLVRFLEIAAARGPAPRRTEYSDGLLC